jgi:hypothetical protein
MKPTKMLGLAALAAAIMTVFNISSVMANPTALCSVDGAGGSCSASTKVSHAHSTTLTGAKASLLNSISNILCDILLLGDVTSAGSLGSPLVMQGNMTATNCVDEKPNSCTVTEEGGPSEAKALLEGHETAKVTMEGLIKVVCTGISCKYNGENLIATFKGPLLSSETNGEATIIEQTVKKVSGLLCPTTAKLDGTITMLEATYITS